ncbi:hypothetical protein ACF09Y_27760 [Streptomyces massasporeus]
MHRGPGTRAVAHARGPRTAAGASAPYIARTLAELGRLRGG